MNKEEGKRLKYIILSNSTLGIACPDCGKALIGDNTFISPYACVNCNVKWICDDNSKIMERLFIKKSFDMDDIVNITY